MPDYGRALEGQLATLQARAAGATEPQERYYLQRLLIDRYTFFNIDSALHYIRLNYDLATALDRPDWTTETLLADACVHSTAGFMDEALTLLTQVSRRPLTDKQRLEYYLQQLYYWPQYSTYTDYWAQGPVNAYSDSILSLDLDPGSPAVLWAVYLRAQDATSRRQARQTLLAYRHQWEDDELWKPRLCTALGYLAHFNGDDEEAIPYFVESLCIDIGRASRYLPTLSLVARLALERGEYNYAFRFMQAYMDVLPVFADRTRGISLTSTLHNTYDSILQRLEHNRTQQRRLLITLAIVLALLIASVVRVVWLWRRQVHLRRQLAASRDRVQASLRQTQGQREELGSAYADMQERTDRLASAYKALKETDALKDEYIGQLFTLCADYLARMNTQQKNIARKLKAGQWDDLRKLANASSEKLEADAQREFNAQFDRIFLAIFPRFVEEFNALLRPQESISLRRDRTLNTDLRIFALIRLGITSSVKIARILGVSTQTVYNARLRMRDLATPSEQSLPDRVRSLGNGD